MGVAVKCMIVFLVFSMTRLMENASAGRELHPLMKPGFNLTARLETDGGVVDCWNALTEIKSCSNEIVVYFVNGTTDIGPPCCKAISMITHHCWASMLTALGFTPDETNILQGYCDASSSSPSSSTSSSAPAATPSVQPPASTHDFMLI
ncbi:hypothetical protein CsSME_00002318 [Camellia sinensis var. sinensis]|uniref:Prolamin-like domain-containing protein n=1 Tax=Camellia sinensis var. sinensis TaxID=542762 RepID=A0A4S4DDV2_CAMSN|nr:egg cell-secreted protein 1.2-like [Camellia sinensis]THG00838.1 hypothetical protein TEA_017498 [Camellia sinensis var. sinensis]